MHQQFSRRPPYCQSIRNKKKVKKTDLMGGGGKLSIQQRGGFQPQEPGPRTFYLGYS